MEEYGVPVKKNKCEAQHAQPDRRINKPSKLQRWTTQPSTTHCEDSQILGASVSSISWQICAYASSPTKGKSARRVNRASISLCEKLLASRCLRDGYFFSAEDWRHLETPSRQAKGRIPMGNDWMGSHSCHMCQALALVNLIAAAAIAAPAFCS